MQRKEVIDQTINFLKNGGFIRSNR
jgi:hypothetical protein